MNQLRIALRTKNRGAASRRWPSASRLQCDGNRVSGGNAAFYWVIYAASSAEARQSCAAPCDVHKYVRSHHHAQLSAFLGSRALHKPSVRCCTRRAPWVQCARQFAAAGQRKAFGAAAPGAVPSSTQRASTAAVSSLRHRGPLPSHILGAAAVPWSSRRADPKLLRRRREACGRTQQQPTSHGGGVSFSDVGGAGGGSLFLQADL